MDRRPPEAWRVKCERGGVMTQVGNVEQTLLAPMTRGVRRS